jgi:predicted small metal-binding protein
MKSRMVFVVLALALFCTAGAWSQTQETKKEGMKGMEHATKAKSEMGALKSFSCPSPCNFQVNSRDEKELSDAAIAHVKKHHDMTITAKDVAAQTKVVAPMGDKK